MATIDRMVELLIPDCLYEMYKILEAIRKG